MGSRICYGAAFACLATALLSDAALLRASEGASFSRFVVAADHPQASEAGASVLRAGGNAADAAAATMLALGVASPAGSGLGGGGFALYYRASDKSLTFFDFREQAPAAAQADMFRARPGDDEQAQASRSQLSGLAVAVPGEPLGIETLQRRFGKLALQKVVEPAETLARRGSRVTAYTLKALATLGLGAKGDPLFLKLFGAAPTVEKPAVNIALADTLHRFGREGAKSFYRGALARKLVRRVRAADGVLTMADLAAYRVLERAPLRSEAFGHTWVTAPPPSAGGYTLVQSLSMVERTLPPKDRKVPDARMHALIESWKGPYLDRTAYFGDPEHVQLPLTALRSEKRAKERAGLFNPAVARESAVYALPLPDAEVATQHSEDHGTSHLCVVDAEGNIASVTTTVNLHFGSQLSVGGLWLNDQMDDFAREVGKENAFGLVGGAANLPAPGKRPISSMAPTIVFAGEAPVLCIGGSGGSRIPTAVEQVALHVLLDGLHPEAAVTAPRVHHQGSPDRVEVSGVDPAVRARLVARGHTVVDAEAFAHVQLVRIGAHDGQALQAASDPKKGGVPSGE